MDFSDEFAELIKSKVKCIWINSYEIDRVIDNISYVLKNYFPSMDLYTWNAYTGISSIFNDNIKQDTPRLSPRSILDVIKKRTNDIKEHASLDSIEDESKKHEKAVFVLKEFHLFLNSKDILTALLELKSGKYDFYYYSPLVVVAPIVDIPFEARKLFTVIDFKTPNKNMIKKIILQFAEEKLFKNLSNEQKDELYNDLDTCVNYCNGLTLDEIKIYLCRCACRYDTLKPEIFKQARIDLIKATGILDYKECNTNITDMGGNEVFKDWIKDIKSTFSKEAEEFGVKKSKGYLSIGVPGTAKTQAAEMISSMLELPLLKFNMSKIMHSHVGQSEKNMADAINVIKACKPCVLLIDEVEKTLSGTGSSGNTDGGTLMRVVGQLLEFLSDKDSEDVFTIMTSNDSSKLPPELTRSGRLDTIWFFGLPSIEERKDIFKIHFNNTKLNYDDEIINICSEITENFTGAEIKEMVKIITRKVFNSYLETNSKEITNEIIKESKEEIIPVYQSSREKIVALENYAKYRARFASKVQNNVKSKDNILSYDELNKFNI